MHHYICSDIYDTTDRWNNRPVKQQTGDTTDPWNNGPVKQPTGETTDRWYNRPVKQRTGETTNRWNNRPMKQQTGETTDRWNNRPVKQQTGETTDRWNRWLSEVCAENAETSFFSRQWNVDELIQAAWSQHGGVDDVWPITITYHHRFSLSKPDLVLASS